MNIWGLGIGDWGLGIGDWAQSPIPNPHYFAPLNIFIENKSKIIILIKIWDCRILHLEKK